MIKKFIRRIDWWVTLSCTTVQVLWVTQGWLVGDSGMTGRWLAGDLEALWHSARSECTLNHFVDFEPSSTWCTIPLYDCTCLASEGWWYLTYFFTQKTYHVLHAGLWTITSFNHNAIEAVFAPSWGSVELDLSPWDSPKGVCNLDRVSEGFHC